MVQKQDNTTSKDSSPQDSERGRALTAALAQIERQFGKGSLMRLGTKSRFLFPQFLQGPLGWISLLALADYPEEEWLKYMVRNPLERRR